ncbi:S49 family peptidase [Hydrogenovibrio kuenenii]|uniref:S49 family peptidase n=1 Tax=Hydrogenovibrio kuenenii TaxID=63658 RepID=UPI000464090D|nr:S49 family peptidase [Hydrogenovibrio kuenenii]
MEQNKAFDRLATAAENFIKQERWSRRWSNLLKIIIVLYILVSLGMLVNQVTPGEESSSGKHVGIVSLQGAIMPGSKTSADSINPLLRNAFSDPKTQAVIIKANSPGGSPVQAAMINDEITRLKNKYKKPVYVVVQDLCASGCYYIAVAGDKIFANKGSIIGSIGVRMDTFGFTGLMDKLGIENRSMHSGDHKTFIDPFSAKDKSGREFFQKNILDRTHEQFIETVKKGRGDRLKINKDTFTGLVWLGDDAVKNGLIDGLGDTGYVERNIIKNTNEKTYEGHKSLIEQMMGDISTETASKLSLYLSQLY